MKHIGLFEGIGGFSLAARWMEWETIAWCEWNEFGQRVLRHHFPEAIGHGDITKTDFTPYANTIDILTGGFPCQPYSAAGKRRGKEDDRHLWPQMCRAIREIAPRFVVGENVLGLVNWNGGLVFDEVQADLEAEGYEVAPVVIPAAAVNAPHGRDRIWFVAYRTGRGSGGLRNEGDKERSRCCDELLGISGGLLHNDGPTPDTDSPRRQEWIDSRQSTNEAQGGTRVDDRAKRYGNDGLTPDTDNVRLQQRTYSGEIRAGQAKVCTAGRKLADASEANGKERPTPDTDSARRGQNNWERKSRFNDQKSSPNDWDNFPTQSPICGGDDGLPRQLDGITFPKWRAESIKAYGNAIVPQVAYQLFKAIQAHENLTK